MTSVCGARRDSPAACPATVSQSANVASGLETDRLLAVLAVGGALEMPLQDMFCGGYLGSLTDRFGIRWMFDCSSKVYRPPGRIPRLSAAPAS